MISPLSFTVLTPTITLFPSHDPSSAMADTQPMGYDQFTPFYGRYTVIGSKISLYCMNTSVGDNVIVGVNTVKDNGEIIYTGVHNAIEYQPGNFCFLGPHNSGAVKAKCTAKYSAKNFFGVKNPMDDDSIGSQTNANPTAVAYFACYCTNVRDGDDVTVNCIAVIEYIVTFTEQLQLGGS